jgi:hypothetical protein
LRISQIALAAVIPCIGLVWGQTTASVTGTVTDPSGAGVGGARVIVQNALTGYELAAETKPDGSFQLVNIPLRTYALSVRAAGFQIHEQSITFSNAAAQVLAVKLKLMTAESSTTVSAFETLSLVTPEDTGTRAQINQKEIERLVLSVGNRGLEAVVQTFPGFAQNANGAIHPRGAHTQLSFIIDGMPITDQLTGAFANAVDPNIVQNVEIFTGNIPAEYGAKIAAVINVNTKSGLGTDRRFMGSTALSGAGFDTVGQVTQFAGQKKRFGYSGLVNTMKSNRYLDSVSLDNLHNGGNSQRGFLRLDYQASDRDVFRVNFLMGRAPLQLANLRSQHANGMNQRQELGDFSTAFNWVRTLDPRSTYEMNYSVRTSTSTLLPSAGDTPVTASQERRLTTVALTHRYATMRGRHNIRGGVDIQRIPLQEQFTFGITDSDFNRPGTEEYLPTLRPFDLSRGGGLFRFSERGTGGYYSGHLQDSIKLGSFQVSLGLRYDIYRFLVDETLWQPRVGLSYHVKKTGTVFRASYNRLMQTPQNENLLVSSSDKANVLVDPEIRATTGDAVARIRPEKQNLMEVGFQQSLGRRFSLNSSFYHKNARNQQDVNNFFNTPIVFPLQLLAIRVNSVETRMVMTAWKGFSGSLAATHARAISTPPFVGGLYLGNGNVTLLNEGPFVIDHDQKISLQGVLNYTHRKGWYSTVSVRHDSGLVTGGADPEDVKQQPDYFDLLPYVNLLSDPPRTRPRTIVDVVVGYERFRNDRKAWDVNFQVSNIGNQTALYNFQSAFVGTRVVQPRTLGARIRFYF